MRYLFLFLIAGLLTQGFTQDRVAPNYKPGKLIFDAALTGSTAGTYTDAFPIKNMLGATSIFFKSDTTGAATKVANQSDSCLTVGIILKDNDIGWGTYYTSATNTYTRIDTIDRIYINTGGTVIKYIDLAQLTGWQSADSAKIWLQIGTTDTLDLDISYGGH